MEIAFVYSWLPHLLQLRDRDIERENPFAQAKSAVETNQA